ncbi:MAG TPA: hypothetical protein QGF58_11780 [Myxococcota bacterium]|nr:hypothetical protein [Myxococcota bacterium]
MLPLLAALLHAPPAATDVEVRIDALGLDEGFVMAAPVDPAGMSLETELATILLHSGAVAPLSSPGTGARVGLVFEGEGRLLLHPPTPGEELALRQDLLLQGATPEELPEAGEPVEFVLEQLLLFSGDPALVEWAGGEDAGGLLGSAGGALTAVVQELPRRLVDAHSGERIGWGEVRATLEAASGRDLEGFFSFWIEAGRLPRVEATTLVESDRVIVEVESDLAGTFRVPVTVGSGDAHLVEIEDG